MTPATLDVLKGVLLADHSVPADQVERILRMAKDPEAWAPAESTPSPSTPSAPGRILSYAAAGEFIGKSRSYIERQIAAGRLRAFQPDPSKRATGVTVAELHRFLETTNPHHLEVTA